MLIVAIVVMVSRGHDKAKPVPDDDKHRPFYEAIQKGTAGVDVEKGCLTCHNPQANPLPEKHPPKEQCLVCHKLRQTK